VGRIGHNGRVVVAALRKNHRGEESQEGTDVEHSKEELCLSRHFWIVN